MNSTAPEKKVFHMTFKETDPGYCRVYYKCGKGLYCLQQERVGVYEFYNCSYDGEPISPLKINTDMQRVIFDPIPIPDEWERGFNNFLSEHGALAGQVS